MYRKVRPLEPSQIYDSDLTDAQWARIAPLFPPLVGSGRRQQIPLRLIVNACLYLLRTGCQWRLLPKHYPKWQIVYYHFSKWRRDHTWEDILSVVRAQARLAAGRPAAPSMVIVDSQSAKTTEMGGEVGFDGGKKGEGPQAAYRGGHPGDAGGRAGTSRAHP